MEQLKYAVDGEWLRKKIKSAEFAFKVNAGAMLRLSRFDLVDVANVIDDGTFHFIDCSHGGYYFKISGTNYDDKYLSVAAWFDDTGILEIINISGE